MDISRQRRARQAEVARNDAALLAAARLVFAREGARASVAAIAEAAGVGVGTLYRRYTSKTALFERLLVLANEQWAAAVERAVANPDPWGGLRALVVESVEYGQGTLAPLGRLGLAPRGLGDVAVRADAAFGALVVSAHRSGGLRDDVTATDILLLIEQLGRSPLVEQIRDLGDEALDAEAYSARRRLIAIALDGLAAGPRAGLPSSPPSERLLAVRWPEEGSG
ncbi:TetR/AcrR family transcriptional regulator [Parafrankia sp. FMc2]|uniref:TetR/AcrR family transcriptional regulator n=1 Tax=Parafrankia sp. FMc2 TaxID=3233196 RepID=UPI0034D70724